MAHLLPHVNARSKAAEFRRDIFTIQMKVDELFSSPWHDELYSIDAERGAGSGGCT